MGYIIKSIIKLIINLFFEEVELNAPESSTPVEPTPQAPEKTTIHQRAMNLNHQLREQRCVSWSEFKQNNAMINNYLINNQAVP